MATYAATDFHGMYGIWKKIKEYMKPDDTLYYLGDAIDRGPRGFEIFMELLDDSRVTYIKGNHEDMMYNAFTATGPAGTEWFKAWRKNGARETLNNISDLGLTYEQKMQYVYKIQDMPTSMTIVMKDITYYLSHAGFTPNEKYFSMYDFDREHYNLWNRKHFFDDWPESLNHCVILHGHTPIPYMFELIPGIQDPIIYCSGHKINLDTGAFDSNMAILYNLDKNDIETYFKGE